MPVVWTKLFGKGRVFYSSLGHRDEIWESAMFQSVLMGGINWALGRVDADVTPNVDQAAPQEMARHPIRQIAGDDTAQGEILMLRPNVILRVTVYRFR